MLTAYAKRVFRITEYLVGILCESCRQVAAGDCHIMPPRDRPEYVAAQKAADDAKAQCDEWAVLADKVGVA